MTTIQHPRELTRTFAWRPLARHYLEMVGAMFAGMLVLGGLRGLAGLTLDFQARPAAAYTLMAVDMSVAMAVWMRYRRHGWPATLEMCAAMFVPLAIVPLVWGGGMSALTFMVLAHVVMLLAMLGVLLRRRHELHHGETEEHGR